MILREYGSSPCCSRTNACARKASRCFVVIGFTSGRLVPTRFRFLRDVIASAAGRDAPEDGRVLIDHARSGSPAARAELAKRNVVIGPWGASQGGLLWR